MNPPKGHALNLLKEDGYVVDIGQIHPDDKKVIKKLVKQGKAWQGKYYGFPVTKTMYTLYQEVSI